MWSNDTIADAVLHTLEARERALSEEQAVYGLDALQELELHAIIADGLALTSGFGVLREQAYPHEWTRKRATIDALPIRRDRMRADIVLTDRPGQRLDDAVASEKQRRAERKLIEGSLFAALAPAESPPAHDAVQPEDALWMEIKVIAQQTLTAGVLGPNRAYSSELIRGPIADLVKLAADERIHAGAAVIVLFAQTEAVARHDLNIVIHKSLEKQLPVISPAIRCIPIADRLGNACCAVCVIGVWRV